MNVNLLPVALAVACLVSTSGGCVTTHVVPPPPSGDDVGVFVTDYGRHSSLILPAPAAGHYNEYAFGDFKWFALSQTRGSDAARAMVWSAGSTLGRRQLKLVDDPAAVASDTWAASVIRIEAPRAKVNSLRERLDAAYFARHDTVTYNPASGMWFVRSREPYHALHNCNHLTARWLRALGCEIRGTAAFSKFRISPRRGGQVR